MASFPELRPTGKRPADDGRFVVAPPASLLGAALLACAVLVALAVSQLLSSQSGGHASFLARSLGAPAARTPLVRRPANGLRVAVAPEALQLSRGSPEVSSAAPVVGLAPWQRL